MTTGRTCGRCGGDDFSPSGICRPCQAEKMRVRRAAKSAGIAVGRPKRKGKMSAAPPEPPPEMPRAASKADAAFGALLKDSNALLDAVSNPKNRLRFMMALHQRTLQDFDDQRAALDVAIQDALDESAINDYKDFLKERISLTKASSDYNLKMSKELQVFQELASKEDTETPITFMQVGMPPREWVTVRAVGEDMDFSSYMPERATQKPREGGDG